MQWEPYIKQITHSDLHLPPSDMEWRARWEVDKARYRRKQQTDHFAEKMLRRLREQRAARSGASNASGNSRGSTASTSASSKGSGKNFIAYGRIAPIAPKRHKPVKQDMLNGKMQKFSSTSEDFYGTYYKSNSEEEKRNTYDERRELNWRMPANATGNHKAMMNQTHTSAFSVCRSNSNANSLPDLSKYFSEDSASSVCTANTHRLMKLNWRERRPNSNAIRIKRLQRLNSSGWDFTDDGATEISKDSAGLGGRMDLLETVMRAQTPQMNESRYNPIKEAEDEVFGDHASHLFSAPVVRFGRIETRLEPKRPNSGVKGIEGPLAAIASIADSNVAWNANLNKNGKAVENGVECLKVEKRRMDDPSISSENKVEQEFGKIKDYILLGEVESVNDPIDWRNGRANTEFSLPRMKLSGKSPRRIFESE